MKKPSTRLLEGAWLSCGALVVRIGFGLFLTPYMLSALGDQSYGVFALASLFAGWCGLLDFGLTTTTSRFVTRCYTRQDWRGMNEIGRGNLGARFFDVLRCVWSGFLYWTSNRRNGDAWNGAFLRGIGVCDF